LIRYARASSNYSDFLKRHLHLRNRLLDQGYKKIRLIRSLKNLYKKGTIRTHWYADDLLKQCPSKGDKYVIDEELQHTDHLFLGVTTERNVDPPELEVKETTDTASSASFLDLYLEIDDSGQLSTKIYDKRDDFNFKSINFPNMYNNMHRL
jgi:hypothetical protein